jgi:ankyrin repeat protein
VELVLALISAGANVDLCDEQKWGQHCEFTPLMRAVMHGHGRISAATVMVRALINARANVNAKDSLWHSALFKAAYCPNQAVVKLLIQAGANIEEETLETDWDHPMEIFRDSRATPFISARDYIPNMIELINAGANLHRTNQVRRSTAPC